MSDETPALEPEGTPKQPSPEEVADMKATLSVLQTQLEEAKKSASTNEERHRNAELRMHEATRELAAARKESEKAKSELTPEDAAKLLDDPKALLDYVKETGNQTASELRQEMQTLAEDIAKAIVERDASTQQALKNVDPRLNNDAFKAKKAQYGDVLSDEQILQIIELDGKTKAPPPPAGSGRPPIDTKPKEDEAFKAAKNSIFGSVIDRYTPKENK